MILAHLVEEFASRRRNLECFERVAHDYDGFRFKELIVDGGVREPVLDIVHIRIVLIQFFYFGTPRNYNLFKLQRFLVSFDLNDAFINVNGLDLSFDQVYIGAIKVVILNHEALIFCKGTEMSSVYFHVFEDPVSSVRNQNNATSETGSQPINYRQSCLVIAQNHDGPWINLLSVDELLLAERRYVLWNCQFQLAFPDPYWKARQISHIGSRLHESSSHIII